MCTAIRFNERYFGRTFDFERSFGESLVVTPREKMKILEAKNRYAMMGVGVIFEDTPLYFDGVNEWGLAMAALNFPFFAVYSSGDHSGTSVPSGGLISQVLGLCRSVAEAREMLSKITLTDESVFQGGGASPLHWMICDGRESVVVEPLADGLRISDNPVGVLTNSPSLDYQLTRLADLSNLRTDNPEGAFGGSLYSRGMGAIGLPGDFSSTSRFVRSVFLKENAFGSVSTEGVGEISRAFSVLSSASIPVGAVLSDEGLPVFTMYTALIDMEQPSYYLTSASCRTVLRARLSDRILDGKGIQSYPIYRGEIIAPIIDDGRE